MQVESALVVVDMQPIYLTREDHALIERVGLLIDKAIAAGQPIVLLEYAGKGRTCIELIRRLEGYALVRTKQKYGWGGAAETMEAFADMGVSPLSVSVCGVYTEQCVAQTVLGLVYNLPGNAIDVLTAACLSIASAYDWSKFPVAGNVNLVAVDVTV